MTTLARLASRVRDEATVRLWDIAAGAIFDQVGDRVIVIQRVITQFSGVSSAWLKVPRGELAITSRPPPLTRLRPLRTSD